MDVRILIDFGSTYTKILAIDLDREILLGRAQALTTVNSDITIGLRSAYAMLLSDYDITEQHIRGHYASSSAAGGLRIGAIGLVPALTLEAARRAAPLVPAPRWSAVTDSRSMKKSSPTLRPLPATSSC